MMADSERNKGLRVSCADAHNTSFQRRGELAGVEIRALKDSARTYYCYGTGFQFFAPLTWHGELWHRRRRVVIGPGMVLCTHPGEVLSVQRVTTSGAVNVLSIDPSVFQSYLAAHSLSANDLQLRGSTTMSRALEQSLLQVFRVVRPGPRSGEVRAAMAEFLELMVVDLLEPSSDATASVATAVRAAELVRQSVHCDVTATGELSALAHRANVSRFQALRKFKLRYGLPPHAYQLSVRVALAQKALREGQLPAEVAALYGFFDQSHLTRHFKRLLGVTPAQYARVGAFARTRTDGLTG